MNLRSKVKENISKEKNQYANTQLTAEFTLRNGIERKGMDSIQAPFQSFPHSKNDKEEVIALHWWLMSQLDGPKSLPFIGG